MLECSHPTHPLPLFLSRACVCLSALTRAPAPRARAQVLSTHADVERARRLLGYKPTTSLNEGLRKFVAWFKSPLFKDEYATDGLWKSGKAWGRYT